MCLFYVEDSRYDLNRKLKSYDFDGCTSLRSHSMLDFRFTNFEITTEKQARQVSEKKILTNQKKDYSSLCLDQIIKHFEENLVILNQNLKDCIEAELVREQPLIDRKNNMKEMKSLKSQLSKIYDIIHSDDSSVKNLQK